MWSGRHNNEHHPVKKKQSEMKKMKPFKRSLRKHQKYQYSHCRDFRRIRGQKGDLKNVLEEIMAENFPNLTKERDSQVDEACVCVLSHFFVTLWTVAYQTPLSMEFSS